MQTAVKSFSVPVPTPMEFYGAPLVAYVKYILLAKGKSNYNNFYHYLFYALEIGPVNFFYLLATAKLPA